MRTARPSSNLAAMSSIPLQILLANNPAFPICRANVLRAFVGRWDQAAPLLIHCFAGVSRSTAAAFIAACAVIPHRDEAEIALAVRRNSPTATPNPRLVALADKMLGRKGRMIAAIARIGRGVECSEAIPFALELR
jgi:predicted protein tyrosine phosphatase